MSVHIFLNSLIIIHLTFAFCFFFNDTATSEIYTLSLHDALPIWAQGTDARMATHALLLSDTAEADNKPERSEEHTSELQSRRDLVCRLLLEKKKKRINKTWMNPTISIANFPCLSFLPPTP